MSEYGKNPTLSLGPSEDCLKNEKQRKPNQNLVFLMQSTNKYVLWVKVSTL